MVLKIHMHCEACPQKIKGCIQSMKGVESVEPDPKSMQVSVKGVYDPAKLVEYVHKRTGKQAVIVKKEPEKKEKVEEAKEEDSRKEKKSDGEGEENKEKKEEAKGEAKAEEETTAAAASTGESNNEVPEPQIIVTVLKIHMHCKACAQKIKGCIQSMKGVESVEPDLKNMQVSVKGMYDPAKLVEYVHKRTGKQAVIVKKEPEKEKVEEAKEEEGEKEKKNDGEGEEKKEEAKGEAKAEEETTAAAASTEESNIEVPEPQIIVTVLKIHMHCKACPQKIKRCIQSMKGVESVEPDLKSMRVSVKGVYDPAKLVEYVHKRTGKQAVIVKKEPEKKEKVEEAKQEKKEER
ncbi:Copper transport protein CCH [Spatholobus suberectus]|nr:Copper transport protein CCH [Spatholobus suberectus]